MGNTMDSKSFKYLAIKVSAVKLQTMSQIPFSRHYHLKTRLKTTLKFHHVISSAIGKHSGRDPSFPWLHKAHLGSEVLTQTI